MDRGITRRDFLNGVALTVGASLTRASSSFGLELVDDAPEKAAGYYPPALTGLRGSHEGSYAAAHELRDGHFWDTAAAAADTGEEYDLVVVTQSCDLEQGKVRLVAACPIYPIAEFEVVNPPELAAHIREWATRFSRATGASHLSGYEHAY